MKVNFEFEEGDALRGNDQCFNVIELLKTQEKHTKWVFLGLLWSKNEEMGEHVPFKPFFILDLKGVKG